jgi:hypothetical protein
LKNYFETMDDAITFWLERYVAIGSGCWISEATPGNDRPVIRHLGVNKLLPQAALERKLGRALMPGEDTRHSCHNPRCIRPDHLNPGSRQDNVDDMVNAGRALTGDRNPHSKLTDAEVAEIREKYTGANGQQALLALEYGVSQPNISMIVNLKSRVGGKHGIV